MPRPPKNNCDYFPHDRDMRNHKKVKAIRSKFGISGYAVWSMMLEYLTGNDGNVFEYSDMEFELMAGDFGVPATEIRSVVDYCITLEMLFNSNGFIRSESLDDRLAPVYQKRGIAKELSKKQRRDNGRFAVNNTESIGISVTEIPHIKENRSKEEESKKDSSVELAQQVLGIIDEIKRKHKPEQKFHALKVFEKRVSLVNGRFKDFNKHHPGRDFLKACGYMFEYMSLKWLDDPQQWTFIRPETLLLPKHFLPYLEEAHNNKGVPPKKEAKTVSLFSQQPISTVASSPDSYHTKPR
jgi:hypothetical protein